MLLQPLHNIFLNNYKSTIGVDFSLKVVKWNNITIKLYLWDIAGHERFHNMTNIYYKGAAAAFIICDVSRKSSFDNVLKWKQEINNKIPDRTIPIILLRNKIDSFEPHWQYTNEQLDYFCKNNGFVNWIKTSVKNNIGIDTAFIEIIDAIMENNTTDNLLINSIKLDQQSKKSSCC